MEPRQDLRDLCWGGAAAAEMRRLTGLKSFGRKTTGGVSHETWSNLWQNGLNKSLTVFLITYKSDFLLRVIYTGFLLLAKVGL